MTSIITSDQLLNMNPLYTVHLNESELKEKEELLEYFKAKYMRGVWNMFMTMTFNIQNFPNSLKCPLKWISIIHFCFIHYCKVIYCKTCRTHASEFISSNPIIDRIYDCDEDNEMIYLYFEWFYNFRNAANSHSAIIKIHPSFPDVLKFFNGLDSSIDSNDFTYEKIQNGIWHVLLLLSTKCHTREEVSIVYFFIDMYMNFLPKKQSELYVIFKEKHNFEEALYSDDCIESICVSLFDWLYELYSFINSNSEIKVYSKKVIKETYYNISFCTKGCSN